MSKRQYFGTDGIRGRVGGDLINPEFMLRLGWAAGAVFVKNQTNQRTKTKVLIGKDTRNSCDVLGSSLAAGLMAAGVDIYHLGVLPSPGVAHLTHSTHATAGLVISASHNNYQDNGVKIFSSNGRKLDDEVELMIEQQLTRSIEVTSTSTLGKRHEISDAAGRYIEFCKQAFPADLDLQGMKVVLDCANGATWKVAPQIFEELGATLIVIGDKPDGLNINQQCGSTDVHLLQKTVLAENADVGLAFDGDGDRIIMVDHQGEIVDGDEILCILACHSPSNDGEIPGIVGTVMSNLGLERAIRQQGISFDRTAVGDRYVLERLLHKGWFLGGEASGHIINLRYASTGDGIITGLQILAIMRQTKRELHSLKQAMVKRPQVLINVPVNRLIDMKAEPSITQAVAEAQALLQDSGRVLLRASGTELLIRVMVEGEDKGQVTHIAKSLAQQVAKVAKI